ncbi:MauE/DoxX family redox-associated membrane protein [Dinghuibacter silviterrae]|uniref:Methylamine utilisation protein MauE domain-containing protein n=1 Tax=Dinghuibacter silviterrae TaxID=1539049 RepID=A0A4R8DWH2_9BACT|nr:MauE/DoxX family redox-associated membrane protein [Dinghuibacter silviterrae]TDX01855.1 hypothetical protein EDB95_2899 [Dinghuibacter silviterrae]
MTILKRSTFTETITFLFVVLFLYTGISKAMGYSIIKEQIGMSPLLSPFAPLVATTIPYAEFAAVLLLIVPRWRLKGFYASLALMTIFTIYIIMILLFNKDIPCSCGGIIELLSWTGHIFLNGVFIVLALAGIVLERKIKNNNRRALGTITNFGN